MRHWPWYMASAKSCVQRYKAGARHLSLRYLELGLGFMDIDNP